MDDRFSDLIRLLRNGQKSDSFEANFGQHFNTTISRIELCNYMMFKVVNQLNLIGGMNTFTKPNCNICMEERLTILKKLHEKCVTVMNNNSEIYGAFRQKTNLHQFFLITDDHFFNSGFSNIGIRTHQRSF